MIKPYNNIGLLGFYGYGNLGDAAIQETIMYNIRLRIPDVKIICFSLNPEDTIHRHGVEAFPISRKLLFHKTNGNIVDQNINISKGRISNFKNIIINTHFIYRLSTLVHNIKNNINNIILEGRFIYNNIILLKKIDLLIVAGGGAIDDEWGGPWEHPYTLLIWSIIAKISNTKYIFLNIGASLSQSKLSKYFVRKALSLSDYRSYRDVYSMELCRQLTYGEIEPVTADSAFGYPLMYSNELPYKENKRLIIGISPMAYCSPKGGWSTKDEKIYENYIKKMCEFSNWLSQNGYEVRYFISQIRNDIVAVQDILKCNGIETFEAFPQSHPVPLESEVKKLISEISNVDIVIASRLHGIILSYLMMKPVIAISYHPKVESVVKDFGLEQFILNIDNFSVIELINCFNNLKREMPSVKLQLGRKISQYQEALNNQYDNIFCTEDIR